MCAKYMWSYGIFHIKANVTYQGVSQGGLGMYSFDQQNKALKLKWIVHLLSEDQQFWKIKLVEQLHFLLQQVLRANIRSMHVPLLFKQNERIHPFWDSILRIWCTYNYTSAVVTMATMPLMLNSALKFPDVLFNPVYNDCYIERGILTAYEFVRIFPSLSAREKHFLYAGTLWNKLPPAWQQFTAGTRNTVTMDILVAPRSTGYLTKNIIDASVEMNIRVITQWQMDLEIDNLASQWTQICNRSMLFNKVSLHSFYIRFVHRTYATNVRLVHMKVLASDKCSFCKAVTETRIHLFWECPIVHPM